MRDMTHRERESLDRHITGNYGENQFDSVDPDEVDYFDAPEPCPECDWVGCHGEGCSSANESYPAV